MQELIQTGGQLGIIIVALLLLLQIILPLVKKDKDAKQPTIESLFTQHDNTRLLNDVHGMLKIQNEKLERIAKALESQAVSYDHIKDYIERMPKEIAKELRRGNGHA